MIVKPLNNETFMDAFGIVISNYMGDINDTMKEIQYNTEGVVIYDGDTPVGFCGVFKSDIYGYMVTNCVVNEEYKGTKYAYRLLREMKRMTNRKRFVVSYVDDLHGYKGKVNSIEHIIETKGEVFSKDLHRIRGK